jgi:hypothetical protein
MANEIFTPAKICTCFAIVFLHVADANNVTKSF